MAEKKPAKKGTQKSARSTSASTGFTDEERAAMRERARELKAASRAGTADGESEVLAEIAAMPSVRIVEPLETKPWGLRQFTVEDLDGNRFYVHSD